MLGTFRNVTAYIMIPTVIIMYSAVLAYAKQAAAIGFHYPRLSHKIPDFLLLK